MNQARENAPVAPGSRPRWWPAVLFLVLTTAAILWVRLFSAVPQQQKNERTYLLCAIGFLGLLLWLMLLSRLPWRLRWILLGIIAVMHVIVLATVRIAGVDGNLVPILEWRWKPMATRSPAPVNQSSSLPSIHSQTPLPDGWPQFLGPNRNGKAVGIHLESDWIQHPPRELWRVTVGPGWSGFAIAQGFAVTQEQTGDQESVIALEALSGRRLWTHCYPARYATTIAGEGPRATPCIDEGRVYASGATGWLTCLDLHTGQTLWARNLIEDSGAVVPDWGFSVSPLIVGQQVILSVGGSEGRSLLSLDKLTGATLWSGGKDRSSYSSPIVGELCGQRQVVVFNRSSAAGHDLENGRVLWERPFAQTQVHVASPLVLDGNRVLFSSGYGHGSELYAIHREEDGRWTAAEVWTSKRMKAKFTNLVEYEGYIYGLDDGILACIDAAAGQLQWKDGRYGHGQILLVGGLLLVMAETGKLALVELRPDRWLELGAVRVFAGKTWNPPAIAGRYLFLRTDREAVCLELALAE